MNLRRYFVVVFGDPEPDKDRVESGVYQAGTGYPPFDVEPSDMLLLYCTEGYAEHSKSVPGIGKVLGSKPNEIKYEYVPLRRAISRETILQNFKPDEVQKMTQLGITTRRVFEISKRSFFKVTGDQIPADSIF